MRKHRRAISHVLVLCAASWLATALLASPAHAGFQTPISAVPVPRLFTISPAGGKAGTTVEISWTGADAEEPQGFYFSHPAFKAEPVLPPPPDPKKPPAKPAAPQAVTRFKVTIPPEIPPGSYDIRLVNKWGISNPRAFSVDDLPEVMEKEPNDDVPQAQRVEINTVINGLIASPTDVDYFVFAGKQGQRVLLRCYAASIDSRLLAGLQLYDSAGKQVASGRYHHDQDVFIDYTLPRDGDYTVRLKEFAHAQGSVEHFYRLKISTTPWIDAITPLAVQPGRKAHLTIFGRNLPGGQVDPTATIEGRMLERLNADIDVPADAASLQRISAGERVAPDRAGLDGFEYRIRNGAGSSNPFLLMFGRERVITGSEENHALKTPQTINPPCEISGSLDKGRDRDRYVFSAKKDEVYTIELFGERLGAPVDYYMIVRNATTKQELANLDDNADPLHAVKFNTASSDPPPYRFVAPAAGKYEVMVSSRDRDRKAGPRRYYHLRIAPETADFRLIVLPADDSRPDGFCLRQGGSEQYTVLVLRRDQFTGPVLLSVEGLPSWATCPPQLVGPNLRQTTLVLSAAANAPLVTGEIKIKGTALIAGRNVVHEAQAASITWPIAPGVGLTTISRLDRTLVMAIRENAAFQLTALAEKAMALQGSKVDVAIKLKRLWPDFKAALQVTVIDAATNFPPNVLFNSNQPLTIAPGKDEVSGALEIKNGVPPGTYNLVLQGTAQVPFNKDSAAKEKPNITVILPATPIALTILPQQVANLTISNPNPQVKVGAQTELHVKIARLNAYTGGFKVQLVLPPTMSDIGADEVTIPSGKEEVKLILKASANAAPGNRPNLVIRATAVLEGNNWLAHEAKINVNVVK